MGKSRTVLSLFIFLLALPALGAAQCENDGIVVDGKLGAKLDLYMTRLTTFGFSGAILVAKAGKVILQKGYGWADMAHGIPITPATVFDVASLTKQFTAAAIVKLEMQARLKTSDHLSKFLANVPKDKAKVTLHHLLTHTSGLPADYLPGTNLTREQFVAAILHTPLAAPPGQKYSYSNAGYTLLAAIIESVTGQSYEAFLTEQLFKPAGMVNTGFYQDSSKWDPALVAHGYNESFDNGSPLLRQPDYKYRGAYFVLTSVADLYKWEVALRRNTVLSEKAKRKLFTAHTATDERGVSYGYGWKIEATEHRSTLISHGGIHPDGFNCLFQRFPNEDVVVIAVSNKIWGGFLPMVTLQYELARIIFDHQYSAPPDYFAIDPGFLKKYAGIYELPSGAKFNVAVQNDMLKIAAEGQDAIDMLVSAYYRKSNSHVDFNSRSAAILAKASKGDFSPFGMRGQNRPTADQSKTFFSRLWMQLNNGFGTLQSFEILGTVPAIWAPTTYVRLNFEHGSGIHRFQWQNGGAFTFVPGSLPLIYTLFVPQSLTEFMGFHPGIAKLLRASFKLSDEGMVTGLTMQDDENAVFARKQHAFVPAISAP